MSYLRKASQDEIEYLWQIAEYQFNRQVADCLFSSKNFLIRIIKSTNRIRYIYLEDKKSYLILRAQDNLFSLTLLSAEVIKECVKPIGYRALVMDEVKEFISKGKNVFAKHILKVDKSLRPGDEVIIVDSNDNLLGIGKMKLSGEEILEYRRGVGIIVKRGVKSE
jgi:uncharacterized protein with predicted RNA binding PUA domain